MVLTYIAAQRRARRTGLDSDRQDALELEKGLLVAAGNEINPQMDFEGFYECGRSLHAILENHLTPLKAIRAKCLDCCAGNA